MEKEKIKIVINTELYTTNRTLVPNGFSCVTFFNQGKATAYLNGTIKIEAGVSHEFNFHPGELINSKMDISFDNDNSDKQVVVTTIYYK